MKRFNGYLKLAGISLIMNKMESNINLIDDKRLNFAEFK